jgi:hypothetical protein
MVHLTYEELGERLGLSAHAARMRAKRHHWPNAPGNDGRTRVSVDESELAAESARAGEREPSRAGHSALQDVDHWRTRATELQEEAERWRTVAEERSTALARLEERAGQLQERLDRERALAEQERTRADRLEAELRRPWWRKLLGQ